MMVYRAARSRKVEKPHVTCGWENVWKKDSESSSSSQPGGMIYLSQLPSSATTTRSVYLKDAGGLDAATVDTANPSPWLQMARWRARLHIRAPLGDYMIPPSPRESSLVPP